MWYVRLSPGARVPSGGGCTIPVGLSPLPTARMTGGSCTATLPMFCTVNTSSRWGLAPNQAVHGPDPVKWASTTWIWRATSGYWAASVPGSAAGAPATLMGVEAVAEEPSPVSFTTHGQGDGGVPTMSCTATSPLELAPASSDVDWSQSADPRRASLPHSSTDTSVPGAKPVPRTMTGEPVGGRRGGDAGGRRALGRRGARGRDGEAAGGDDGDEADQEATGPQAGHPSPERAGEEPGPRPGGPGVAAAATRARPPG